MTRSPVVPVALSAIALFALEPFVGKVLLPRLGGTPMVWNTCVMVFQALVLAGYWYSVRLARARDVRAAARWHGAVVAVAALSWPWTVRALWMAPWQGVPPVAWITGVVVAAVGLPFVVLSATSPLVQVWLTRHPERTTPVHRLYGASNMGSIGGLILYVGVLEPFAGLGAQRWLIWAIGIAGAVLVLRVARGAQVGQVARVAQVGTEVGIPAPPATLAAPSYWFMLSFAASLCLFSVNTYLATDVASFPLLFAVPLAIFLLGFAAGFSAWAEAMGRWLDVAAMAVAGAALWYLLRVAAPASTVMDLPLPLLALAALVAALAARLAVTRPDDAGLPAFYTIIGAGGLLAGIVSVLLLPWGWTRLTAPLHGTLMLVTSTVPEYPMALVLGMWLVARGWPLKILAIVALVMVAASRTSSYGMAQLFEARSFYGTLRVEHDPLTGTNRLKNGTTLHGFEVIGLDSSRATSYYHPSSPVGQIITRLVPRRVIAMGLGAGTLAAYAGRGDHYTFLEINPLVEEIASRSGYFSFLQSARARGAQIEVRLGDGRLLAGALPASSWDLMVLDAFASDSIPVHLLTLEAFRLYAGLMSPRGVIAVHVSNRFFDLGPTVAASAEAMGWRWAIQQREQEEADETASTWVMLVPDDEVGAALGLMAEPWQRPPIPAGVAPWTDDRANMLGRLKVVANRSGTTFRMD